MMRRNPNYVLREIAGENILVPIHGDMDFNGILTFNPLGLEIYRRIEEVPSEEVLIQTLCEEYDAPPEVIAADAADFLATLRRENLIFDT